MSIDDTPTRSHSPVAGKAFRGYIWSEIVGMGAEPMRADGTGGQEEAVGHAVVLGLGLMGCDISAIFLAGGWRVTAVEPAGATPERLERICASVAQLGARACATSALGTVADIEAVDFADAALVIEAVPERLELKRMVFAKLDRLVPLDIPVVSNASGLRITDIARDCVTRERMANLHFFLPAHIVPGVEVVRGEHTDPAICDRLAEIMESLGRKPIRVSRDVPGFLANRIQHALMREAFAAIDQGLATAEDVDAAVRFAFGFRYVGAGPILQKELAGLETQLAAAETIYPSLCNDARPSATLQRLVSAGHLGAKTGLGFRRWPPAAVAQERARYERTLLAATRLLNDDEPN